MKNARILIIGCGELGSRHLQAVASLSEVTEIQVVDPIEPSLERGKARIKEIADLNPAISFRWLRTLEEASVGGDLCIIATQAKGRCALVKEIIEKGGYHQFLIEKTMSPTQRLVLPS